MKHFFDNLIGLGYKTLGMPEAGVNVLYTTGNDSAYVFCFVNNDILASPDEAHYSFIRERVMEAFDKAYKNYELIMIISAQDINNARQYMSGIDGYWLINSNTRRLIIYDGQPQELNGMRYMLENYLENGELVELSKETPIYMKKSGRTPMVGIEKGIAGYLTMSNIIIAANLFVFLLVFFGGDVTDAEYIASRGGLTVDGIQAGEYYRMFTSLFLHFGSTHLLYNMLFIFCFGNSIEPFYGRLGLAIVYLGGGLGGSIATYFYNIENNPYAVTAGASGAAYALLGGMIALTIFDSNARRYNNPLALIIIAILFISDGFTSGASVANTAHIGGLFTGFVLGFIVIIIRKKIKKIRS